jgi:hypothetical protein
VGGNAGGNAGWSAGLGTRTGGHAMRAPVELAASDPPIKSCRLTLPLSVC